MNYYLKNNLFKSGEVSNLQYLTLSFKELISFLKSLKFF